VSTAGTADAEAPPASEKVRPAAPKAGIVALATLFRFEACFTRDIVASSIPVRVVSITALAILRRAGTSRKLLTLTNALFPIQFLFILMNDIDVIYAMLSKLEFACCACIAQTTSTGAMQERQCNRNGAA
jgi:hypothetical protein